MKKKKTSKRIRPPPHSNRESLYFNSYPGTRSRLEGRCNPSPPLFLSLPGEGVSGRGEDSRKSSWTPLGLGRVRMKGERGKRGARREDNSRA